MRTSRGSLGGQSWSTFDPDRYWGYSMDDIPVAHSSSLYYKVHLNGTEAVKFGNESLYNFDPPPARQRDFSTCHMATSCEGAFLETLGGIRPLSNRHVDARVITEMQVPEGLRIADFTRITFGAMRMMLEDAPPSLSDFSVTQWLAAELFDAGYNGVQYTPSSSWLSYSVVALWSGPGEGSSMLKSGACQPIPRSVLGTLTEMKAIEVLDEEALALDDPADGRAPEAVPSGDLDTAAGEPE